MSEISLVVDGRELRNWTQWEVESDILTPADAFSLSVGAFKAEDLPTIAPGKLVSLTLQGDVVLKGVIDEVSLNYDANGRRLHVSGRDLAAVMVDCDLPTWSLYDTSLKQAAEKVLSYLQISATVIAEGEALEKGTLKVEPGERAWQFLERYAKQRDVLIWFDPEGLHIAPPNYELNEGWVLLQGQGGNVKSLNGSWSISERFSEVLVKGQNQDGEKVQATRTDDEVPLFRPRRFTEHGASTWAYADARARWELEKRRIDGLKLKYKVAGHRIGGKLWWPGRQVWVGDSLAGLDESLFITAVRRTLDSQGGSETTLTLRRPGALLGQPTPPKVAGGLF